MAQVTLQPKPKIRQLKNFRKFESTTRRAEKCDNIWVTLPKYINRSKSTQLIRFNFWCILCGNKHEPKSGILLCFCHSTSANYWHATAANVCLFHPVSEMGKWIHANPECRFSKKTGIYVKFVLCLTQGPFLTQLNYGLIFFTWTLCSSCGHLLYCFFSFSAKPSADLELVGPSLSPHLLDYRTN